VVDDIDYGGRNTAIGEQPNGHRHEPDVTDEVDKMGNLWKVTPVVGVMFLLQALSLSGIPPFSGFWGKFMIIKEGLFTGSYWLVSCLIIASILTLWSLLRVWFMAFCRKESAQPVASDGTRWRGMAWVCGVMVVVSLGIGLGAEGIVRVSERAADSVLAPGDYAALVMHYKGIRGGDVPSSGGHH